VAQSANRPETSRRGRRLPPCLFTIILYACVPRSMGRCHLEEKMRKWGPGRLRHSSNGQSYSRVVSSHHVHMARSSHPPLFLTSAAPPAARVCMYSYARHRIVITMLCRLCREVTSYCVCSVLVGCGEAEAHPQPRPPPPFPPPTTSLPTFPPQNQKRPFITSSHPTTHHRRVYAERERREREGGV
jgi:hypothetical protein